MSRAGVEAEIRDTLGLVPTFWSGVPDTLIESEWAGFTAIELAETLIPNKYKELIGVAVSGATRPRSPRRSPATPGGARSPRRRPAGRSRRIRAG